jgi:lipocalin
LRKFHSLPQEERLEIIGKCVRKVRHETKEAGEAAVHNINRVHPELLGSYHCPFCQGYHVYSVDKMAKKQKARAAGA